MTSVTRETLIVADASPLIGLAKIGRLGIFNSLTEAIFIPSAVWNEVVGRGGMRPEVADIVRRFQSCVRPPGEWVTAPLSPQVDAGEAAAIAMAIAHPGCLLLIDDAAGRALAEAHDVRCIGTAGFLSRAKKRERSIHSRANSMRLNAKGFFCTQHLS